MRIDKNDFDEDNLTTEEQQTANDSNLAKSI